MPGFLHSFHHHSDDYNKYNNRVLISTITTPSLTYCSSISLSSLATVTSPTAAAARQSDLGSYNSRGPCAPPPAPFRQTIQRPAPSSLRCLVYPALVRTLSHTIRLPARGPQIWHLLLLRFYRSCFPRRVHGNPPSHLGTQCVRVGTSRGSPSSGRMDVPIFLDITAHTPNSNNRTPEDPVGRLPVFPGGRPELQAVSQIPALPLSPKPPVSQSPIHIRGSGSQSELLRALYAASWGRETDVRK